MIQIKAIQPSDIDFLQRKYTLYTIDFRAIGEALNMEIVDMWKYENLLPWILADQNVVVNERHSDIFYRHSNTFLTAQTAPKASTSIYKRMTAINLPESIQSLWTAIPHPDADRFCEERNIRNSTSYTDFLRRNDKLAQKRLLLEQTPKWALVGKNDLTAKTWSKGFFKRQYGSGGFTIFTIDEVLSDGNARGMFDDPKALWFYEEFASGFPCSIQCLRSDSLGTVIFGFSKQKIAEGKHYYGSDLQEMNELSIDVSNQLMQAIEKLDPLLDDYEGFFGIDFMLDGSIVSILEANIRLTAATIPTLLKNEYHLKNCAYIEDVAQADAEKDDLRLTIHPDGDKNDSIRCHR